MKRLPLIALLRTPHLGSALVFAGFFALLGLLVDAVVVRLHLLQWAYPMRDDGLDQFAVATLQLAFGQAWFTFLALALAAGLGYLAVQEFRDTRLRARLEARGALEWFPRMNTYFFQLRLENDGPVMATWYQVRLFIPYGRLVIPDGMDLGDPEHPIRIVAGSRTNWVLGLNRNSEAGGPSYWSLEFSSAGMIAAFPETKVTLCEIFIKPEWVADRPSGEPWRYDVVWDREKRREGWFNFTVPPVGPPERGAAQAS